MGGCTWRPGGLALTFFQEVVVFSFSLHLCAPALHPLGLRVQQLQEPGAVPAARGHPACLHRLRGRLQPGLCRRQARWACWGPVVLPVTEQSLGPHSPQRPVLGGGAGLRVPLEGGAELQAFVFHGDVCREALQLQVCLHSRRHAVRALETSVPAKEGKVTNGSLLEIMQ